MISATYFGVRVELKEFLDVPFLLKMTQNYTSVPI